MPVTRAVPIDDNSIMIIMTVPKSLNNRLDQIGIRTKTKHSQDHNENLGALRRLVATGPSRKIHQ